MAKTNNSTTARQVELIIRQLNSLSTLPEVATTFLTTVAGKKLDKTAITAIIEADPALTAKLFTIAHQESITFDGDKPSVQQAVNKLDPELIREMILSLRMLLNVGSTQSEI